MPQRTVCKNVGGGASVPTELHVEPRYEMHFKDLAVLYAIKPLSIPSHLEFATRAFVHLF